MTEMAPSLPAQLVARAHSHSNHVASRTATAGYWDETSWRATLEETALLHAAMSARRFAAGGVAVIATSARREWPIAVFAAQAHGLITLTIAPDAPGDELAAIAATRQCVVWIAEDEEQFDKAKAAGVPADLPIFVIDPRGLDGRRDEVTPWSQLTARSDVDLAAVITDFEKAVAAIEPDAIAAIVGSHGADAQGPVSMITHRTMWQGLLPHESESAVLGPNDEYVSFLPPAWPHEQQAVLVDALREGAVVSYGSRSGGVLADLVAIQPTVVQAPGAFWDALANDIVTRMESAPRLARSRFNKLCNGNKSVKRRGVAWTTFLRPLLSRIGLRRLQSAHSIGTPAQASIELFAALGITIASAESSAVAISQPPSQEPSVP